MPFYLQATHYLAALASIGNGKCVSILASIQFACQSTRSLVIYIASLCFIGYFPFFLNPIHFRRLPLWQTIAAQSRRGVPLLAAMGRPRGVCLAPLFWSTFSACFMPRKHYGHR